jgi:UPF0716 protein FxsA
LAHGVMILLAGALLLTPGFFTDAFGFSLLVPNIRIWLFERVRQRILNSQNGFSFTYANTMGANRSSQNGEGHASDTTIEGVYEELTPKKDP